ncbi:hypothetical protein GBA52_015877 [Prunus armeniaca]|nr:hypothetical protein GBA52_015877 [Prunus armeniaca]
MPPKLSIHPSHLAKVEQKQLQPHETSLVRAALALPTLLPRKILPDWCCRKLLNYQTISTKANEVQLQGVTKAAK